MKVIIVGANGAVGKTAVAALSGRHEVIKVGRSSGDVQADIEDVTVEYNAIVGTENATTPSGQDYERARRWLTGDVNAAVEGALAAGATDVVVADGHATMRNVLLDEGRVLGSGPVSDVIARYFERFPEHRAEIIEPRPQPPGAKIIP